MSRQHRRDSVCLERWSSKGIVMKPRFSPLLSMAAILSLGSAAAYADPPPECAMHLMVELTPDIPDPHDAGFLSSLLNDHPQYQLNWVKQIDMSFVALDLSGPGP